MKHLKKTLFIWIGIALTPWLCMANWEDPELVYDSEEALTVLYSDIAVDNKVFTGEGPSGETVYGRPHVVFSAPDDSEWRTLYKQRDYSQGWSYATYVDKEPIGISAFRIYKSKETTRPGIVADNVDDSADIVFHHLSNSMYFEGSIPSGATPVSEALFSWKPEVTWNNIFINPPDHLHHCTGLQKGVGTPFIEYSGFYPFGVYQNVVFWTQWDKEGGAANNIYYNYQAGSANKDRTGIEWGDQTCAAEEEIQIGREPYADVGFNRTAPANAADAYMLAVVSHDGNQVYCSIANIPGHNVHHEWRTFTIKPSGESEVLELPSCSFDYSDETPNLHIVYRNRNTSTGIFNYVHRELLDTWGENPYWSSSTTIAQVTTFQFVTKLSHLPQAGPVIAFAENNTRHIAYIGNNYQIYVQKQIPWFGITTTQITAYNDDSDGEAHRWIRMAVDNVFAPTGMCPNLVFDGDDADGDRNIYWTREYR